MTQVKTSPLQKLKKLCTEFQVLQSTLNDFGAGDSEPNNMITSIADKLIEGKDIAWDRVNWELYREPGHKKASDRLTAKAKYIEAAYKAIPIGDKKEADKFMIDMFDI
jgi:hypothetical protein